MIYHGTLYSYHGSSLHSHSTTCAMACYGIRWYVFISPWYKFLTPWYVMVYHSTTFMKVYYSTPKFGIPWYNLPCIYHCVFRSIYPLMNLYHVSNVWNKKVLKKKTKNKQKLHTHTKCFGCGIMFHNFLTTPLCLWNYYFRKILTNLVANYIARSIIPITLQYCIGRIQEEG